VHLPAVVVLLGGEILGFVVGGAADVQHAVVDVGAGALPQVGSLRADGEGRRASDPPPAACGGGNFHPATPRPPSLRATSAADGGEETPSRPHRAALSLKREGIKRPTEPQRRSASPSASR